MARLLSKSLSENFLDKFCDWTQEKEALRSRSGKYLGLHSSQDEFSLSRHFAKVLTVCA
jgi:hypothetical protein